MRTDLTTRTRAAETAGAMRRAIVTLSLAVALAALPGAPRAGVVESPVCRAHLDKVEVTLSRAQSDLEAARDRGGVEECTAMHGQVRVLLAARNVYSRCTTGADRVEGVDLMSSSIRQTTDRIAVRCAKLSAEAQ